ncbi:MAG TPA: serine hydrolase domain-containing protein [Thermomicrobiaceae bacterium]|nr:serine hydrolase domain-containing protein [Thermomicrobiaceae bacterium]
MTESQHANLDEAVHAAMERWSVPGVTVGILRNGDVERRAYGVTSLETEQPVTPDTLFQIGSISKVFTATLAMMLVDDGKLDLDTPVSTYLPDLELADTEALRTITLRHLFSHTSGLDGDRFTDYGLGDDALVKAIAEFNTLRQLTRPGELWTYCNSGFYLAGRVIEQVTGGVFEQVMRERVFEPLGLERTFLFAHEAIVYPVAVGHTPKEPGAAEHEVARRYPLPRCVNAAGGIISTVGDLLKFAGFHLAGGTVDGKQLLSGKSAAAMQQPQTVAGNFAEHYGIGWALHTVAGEPVVGHGGSTNGFQAQLQLVPTRDYALAVLTNSGRGAAAYREIVDWALAHDLGLEQVEPAPVSLSPDQLAWFAGKYHQPNADVTISVQDNGLRAEIVSRAALSDGPKETALPPISMAPIGERAFVVTGGEQQGSRVEFIPAASGAPRFIRYGGRLAEYQAAESA